MEDHIQNPKTTFVVIGGQSFIGKCLVSRLLEHGNWIVRIVDTLPSHHVEQNSPFLKAASDGRACHVQVDVRVKSQLVQGHLLILFKGSSESCFSLFFYLA
ncbi:unnamed protein product [Amaranthus hypochondriacus]